jgi:hypothetical protein
MAESTSTKRSETRGQRLASAASPPGEVHSPFASEQGKAAALSPRQAATINAYSLITPRFWHGMRLATWRRLLAENRFAVSPWRWPMAAAITSVTCGNSLAAALQSLTHGRRAARTELEHPPLFILGHWRSGTTLLHELLVLDDRHTFPTTYQCFAPHHFLLTEWFVSRWMKFLLPKKRPMDDMQAGWDRPQEDEFALGNLGVPSHYWTMAFPNHPPQNLEYLDLQAISPTELARWKAALVWFLRRVALKDPRRIVLKSPTHTARLAILSELFPEAQFIHIVRDPRSLFPSTVRLWQSLNEVQGLQIPHHQGVEEYVLACFERMYGAFFAQRDSLPPSRLVEIRYEDLVADPLGQLQRAYDSLQLGRFDRVRPKLEEYFAARSDYRRNRNEIAPQVEALLRQRWARYFEEYGYGESG